MSSQGPHAPFLISFVRRQAQLHVEVVGESTLDNTLAYWRAIVEEVQRRPASSILLVDQLRGAPLGEGEWLSLVEQMKGHGLERVRIAHVKPQGLQQIEYCEIFARDAGIRRPRIRRRARGGPVAEVRRNVMRDEWTNPPTGGTTARFREQAPPGVGRYTR